MDWTATETWEEGRVKGWVSAHRKSNSGLGCGGRLVSDREVRLVSVVYVQIYGDTLVIEN